MLDEYYGMPSGLYKEFRVIKKINNYFKAGFFISHQKHTALEDLVLPYQPPAQPILIEHKIDRNYIPIGLLTELDLTLFFQKYLNLFSVTDNKWGVYTVLQFIYMHGHDNYNRTVPGNYMYRVSYSDPSGRLLVSYPSVGYGQKYLGYLFGLRHQSFKKIGFNIEVGSGALMQLQIGSSFYFNKR